MYLPFRWESGCRLRPKLGCLSSGPHLKLAVASMAKRKTFLAVTAAVVVLLAAAALATRPAPRNFTVSLTGTPGLKIAGAYVADGKGTKFSGVLPTNFVARARNLTYVIRKQGETGELAGQLSIDGVSQGDSRTEGPFAGVKGGADREGCFIYSWERTYFTTVSQ
jgi:hypothetical protein